MFKKSNKMVEYKEYEIETIKCDRHDYIICRNVHGGWHAVLMIHSTSCKKCHSNYACVS